MVRQRAVWLAFLPAARQGRAAMQVKFTVYNCGTGYNRNKNDVAAELNRQTQSLHMINDGPGGGSAGFLGIKKARGLLGGVGVDANVEATIDEIVKLNTVDSMVVNMCGWSRGAVTCFKIATALKARQDTQNIKINIFAIDPVPGGSGINNHMWQAIGVKENVGMISVVLSPHDRRSLFAPCFPPVLGPSTDVNLMPGDHSTIVEPHGERTEACELVLDMAKRFLIARGTVFKNASTLSNAEVLEKYAMIAQHFDDYAHFAKGAKGKFDKRFDGARMIRDVNRKEIGQVLPVKPAFFLNENHRELYSGMFPCLAKEIDLPPDRAFSQASQSKWMPEFDGMMNKLIETSKMTLYYITACIAKQGR